MNIEGVLVKQDVEKGIECLIKGAAKESAYCYYYLSMLYSEG
jgi:ferritin-like protein